VHSSTAHLPAAQSRGSEQEPGAVGEQGAQPGTHAGTSQLLCQPLTNQNTVLGWSGSGCLERESYHLLIARRVPRNWGQQDRNYSRPPSTVICAGARRLSEPPQDSTIKAGFKPDAGCWDQSMEPQIKHCEKGARRLYGRRL